MRLTKVTIWNYRSFWSDDTEGNKEEVPSATLDLTPGANYLVGANNVGKSNLLRAIALALDPNARYEPTMEAEDIFNNQVLEGFFAQPGHSAFLDEKKARGSTGVYHYGLRKQGKPVFSKWLDQYGTAATFEPWRPVLEYLRKLLADAAAKAK